MANLLYGCERLILPHTPHQHIAVDRFSYHRLPMSGMMWHEWTLFSEPQHIWGGATDLAVTLEGRSQRWLLDPLNQGVVIDAWLVDHARHGIRLQFHAGASGEQVQGVLRLCKPWINPGIFQLPRQDDGHPVV
jgi:hypothetical protein